MKTQHTSMQQPYIFGVALGPGDPDLLTIKGLKILQKVDLIYYPGAKFPSGRRASYAWSILEQLDLDPQKCRGFYLAMKDDREEAEATYWAVFQEIMEAYQAGKTIAIVSEGDLNTYSSFSYLLKHIHQHQLNLKLVPGISSFHLAAAEQQLPLCLQKEQLIVLPRLKEAALLEDALASFNCVVLMKIKSSMALIYEVLQQQQGSKFYYFERLGTSEQFMSSNWEEIQKRDIPYFSLMIIRQ